LHTSCQQFEVSHKSASPTSLPLPCLPAPIVEQPQPASSLHQQIPTVCMPYSPQLASVQNAILWGTFFSYFIPLSPPHPTSSKMQALQLPIIPAATTTLPTHHHVEDLSCACCESAVLRERKPG
jgi:hypothetical protein